MELIENDMINAISNDATNTTIADTAAVVDIAAVVSVVDTITDADTVAVVDTITDADTVAVADTATDADNADADIADADTAAVVDTAIDANKSSVSSVSSLEYCIKLMSTLVRLLYYGVKDPQKYQNIINKIKSIRSLNDQGNKRLKFILVEIVLNSEKLQKQFKPINLKKNNFSSSSSSSSLINDKIYQNKNEIMKSLGILSTANTSNKILVKKNQSPKLAKSKWGDDSSDSSDESLNKK
jgi:hypothetical protein